MKIALYPNFEKNNALQTTLDVCDVLHDTGAEIYARESNKEYFADKNYVNIGKMADIAKLCDIIVAIGGDGTILKSSRYAAPAGKPLLGINTGRLGFMASLERDELDGLHRLSDGDYTIENRMMIDAEYICGEEKQVFSALNDVTAVRMFSRIADFTVSVDGKTVSSMRSDGVVFSTPTGSTAYALSAGGPIVEPAISCIEFAPVCPHSLWSRPMLISADHEITVSHNSDDVYFSVDGAAEIKFECGGRLVITRSQQILKLINIDGDSFFDAVNYKLMRSLK